jgi:hypothetical protein
MMCCFVLQRLRKALGYWLYIVAPLVPLKAIIFADSSQKQQQQQQQQQPEQPPQVQPSVQAQGTEQQQVLQHTQVAALLPTEPAGPQQQQQQQPAGLENSASWKDAALGATGCLAGFASGMLGIGGGTGVCSDSCLHSSKPLIVYIWQLHCCRGRGSF